MKKAAKPSEIREAKTQEHFSALNLTNAEIKKLLERALIRFENWKIQMETNPNPRMVHGLKNIISIIDTLTTISELKMRYSYKNLSRQMSLLIESVAQLNLTITDSLMDDDLVDEGEEENINARMMSVIQRMVELIRLVQQGFGTRQRLIGDHGDQLDIIEEMTKPAR